MAKRRTNAIRESTRRTAADRTMTGRRAVLVTVLIATTLLVAGTAPAGAAATAFQYREQSQGANVVFSPNCPFGDWAPAVDTLCDTYTVWYVRLTQVIDGGPIDTHTPFHAELDHEVDLVHPDGTGYAVSFEYGIGAVAGSYDAEHLTYASMPPVSVEMKAVDLDTGAQTDTGHAEQLGNFAWTARSDVYEWGNNGPVFANLPRHLHTSCLTVNHLAHQKDTLGDVTGAFDGTPISSYYQDVQLPGLQPPNAAGYIFNNWFHVDRVDSCSG